MAAAQVENSLRWPAPAKINLFLHVTGRRPDGYHQLQTVFQFLDLCDYIDFERREDGVIECSTELPGVPAEEDLVVRAARALQAYTASPFGARIAVDKRLPVGGGLGGGSSDAATTLVALDHLWGLGLTAAALAEVGLTLGADVPIFLFGLGAFAEGLGEILTPVEPEECWYLLLQPDCLVSTASVFRDPDLTRNTPPIKIRHFFAGAGHNDCEPVVRRLHPAVGAALDWLNARAAARLTGTGACVFAPFSTEADARRICEQIPLPWKGCVVRGLNRSPLLERVERARNAAATTARVAAGQQAS
ncbi:MAG: 4-(cytidine 5'-diphospho)-2-C-methyl-D-erythritol kinase [Chromatiales bacterium]